MMTISVFKEPVIRDNRTESLRSACSGRRYVLGNAVGLIHSGDE